MGYVENLNFFWSVNWLGNETVPKLYRTKTWENISENWYEKQSQIARLRARCAASLIDVRSTDSVIDLGAGKCLLKDYLPESIKYIPVDYISENNDAIICNFNKYQFPPISVDCICLLGVSRLVDDLEWFVEMISNHLKPGGYLIISLIEFSEARCAGLFNSEFNIQFNYQFIILLSKYRLTLIDGKKLDNIDILKFKKS